MPACAACGFASEGTFRFCPECGTELAVGAPSGEQRRTVTVLFCDLTGSTALGETLDPERLRALLARYFDEMKTIVERHGGAVEKFIGDAVMAVFGVPTLHEDDALRAVRAAVEMRDALPELGLRGRIGVMTGEVVTGTAERLVTGDPVNVAARLEQAAAAGEVLIGQPTLMLVQAAVEVESVEPLMLKGKSESVPAFRLLCVREAPERRHDAPFVGRQRELALVRDALQRVRDECGCELVTIVGEAGVGKSRLVAECLASLEATVVRGRCLPYGEGITYWPVVEVLKQLDLPPVDETAAAAIRSLLGQSEAETSAEEIAWAFRKTLEQAAARRPLVVVFDDIQWGEQTFLDLIEHVALLSTGASILLVCMARPELAERHPTWPVTFRLAPLDEGDVDELIAARIPAGLREQIARAAGGNPLFIEEMLAMAAQSHGDVVVPPTLHALLAARLDQLEASERIVLERGSIEGETFHRGAVQALAPDEAQITPRLASLVRKQLIRPDPTPLPGEDGFRFRHLLLRDASYEGLSKATRADLHQRFAAWLEQHGTELVELDELLGYHLEQSHRYRIELGLPVETALAASARARLAAAGRRAQRRGDDTTAVGLLERAVALVPDGEIDVAAETELVEILYWAGRGDDALPRAESLARRAAAVGDRVGELCARLQVGLIRAYREPEYVADALGALADEALPVLRAAGDDRALFVAYRAAGQAANAHGQMDAALQAYELAVVHSRRAGRPDRELGWRAAFLLFGTAHVSTLLAWLDENEPRETPDYWLRARRAQALGMLGHVEEAREMLARVRAALVERGLRLRLGNMWGISAEVERLAGAADAAAEFGAESCRLLDELGELVQSAASYADLAQALYALGRLDEAHAHAVRAGELGASDDAMIKMLVRQVRAKVLAQRGEHVAAERLAREAVALGDETDMIDPQGDAYADLAEVLLLGDKPGEGAAALEQALDRFERKGNLVSAGRVRARLTDLQDRALQ